jgi:hypothetical protein
MHGSDLLVQVYMVYIYWYRFTTVYLTGISHSDSVTVVPSFYFYFRVAERGKTGGCSHLPVVAGEHWGL